MSHFPIVLKVEGRRALVVGGGRQAARKVELLLDAGAEVTVIAPRLEEDFSRLSKNPRLHHLDAALDAEALKGCVLAIGASEADESLNERLYALATEREIPVNVVDSPELCSFIMPAVVNRAPLMIAISTGGQAPILSRILRARFETLLPAAYGRLTEFAGAQRARVKEALHDPTLRRRFWERVVLGPVAERIFAGEEAAAAQLMDDAIAEAARSGDVDSSGEVYLVGAGPGDPDLITVRGLRLIQACPVCLYAGSLVPESIVAAAPKGARVIDTAPLTLNQIIAEIEAAHERGEDVARVHSGDPSLYGAIAEQIRRLDALGIPFDITPGVSAYAAAAAALGMELTIPEVAQTVILTRTAMKSSAMPQGEDLATLAQSGATLVIHLSVRNLLEIERQLTPRYGADCPVIVAYRVGWPDEQFIHGTLADIRDKVRAAKLTRTALVFVGRVLAETEFRNSALYDVGHVHILRPKRKG